MFIVEGLDYAGKTTVLETLQKKIKAQRWQRWFGHPYIHEIQKWGKLPADFNYCEAYIVAAHSAQLCDRFVLSELAYGDVFRSGPNPKFDSHARRRVQRELNVTGSVTLMVKADWETTSQRAQLRCTSEFDAAIKAGNQYGPMTTAFDRALKDIAVGKRGGSYLGELDTSKRHCLEYQKAGESTGDAYARYMAAYEDVLDFHLEQWRLHLTRSNEVMQACPKSWGYLWPKVLFVGEACNGPDDRRPFAGNDSSSRTLSDMLDLADIGEKDCYFWNAYTHKGNPLTTKSGVVTLRPKLVVALGKIAHEHLNVIGVKHLEFPHPQWIGRFHHKEIDIWASKLRALLSPVLAT